MPQTSLNLLQTTQPSVNFFSRCSEFQGKNNKQLTRCHQTIAYEYLAFSLHVVPMLWGFTVIGAQPSKVSLPSSNVHTRNRDVPKALSPLLPSVQKPLVLKYLKKWVLWPRVLSCPRPRSENSQHTGRVRWRNHHHFLCGLSCCPGLWWKQKPKVLFEILLASATVSCAELKGLGNPGYRLDS